MRIILICVLFVMTCFICSYELERVCIGAHKTKCMGPLLIAGIQAASQIGQSAIGSVSQGNMNRKNRQFAVDMYNQQRKDALSDWNMQNQYNSPEAQMARLKGAGLNPNLVYGNGSAVQTAGTPRASSAPGWEGKAAPIDVGSGISSGLSTYYDVQVKQAQIDNLKTANTVSQQDALLRAAQVAGTNASTSKTLQDTEGAKFDLAMARKLQDVSLQTAQVELDKKKADVMVTLQGNERAAAMNAVDVQSGIEKILNMRLDRTVSLAQRSQIEQATRNLEKDGQLKQLDINIKKMGIQPGDPMIARMIAQYLESHPDIKAAVKEPAKWWQIPMSGTKGKYNRADSGGTKPLNYKNFFGF